MPKPTDVLPKGLVNLWKKPAQPIRVSPVLVELASTEHAAVSRSSNHRPSAFPIWKRRPAGEHGYNIVAPAEHRSKLTLLLHAI